MILSHQQGEPPALPYGVLQSLTSAAQHSQPAVMRYTGAIDDVSATPVHYTEATFRLTLYGVASPDPVETLRTAVMVPQAQEPLLPDTVIIDVGTATYVPEMISATWVPRWAVTITTLTCPSAAVDVDVIEQYSFQFQEA